MSRSSHWCQFSSFHPCKSHSAYNEDTLLPLKAYSKLRSCNVVHVVANSHILGRMSVKSRQRPRLTLRNTCPPWNTILPAIWYSPNRAKPAWGVIMSIVISSLNGSMVCRFIISHLVGYGLFFVWMDVSYRINEIFAPLFRWNSGSIAGLGLNIHLTI